MGAVIARAECVEFPESTGRHSDKEIGYVNARS